MPLGKIATVVTYLEMTAAPSVRPVPTPDGVTLEQVTSPDLDFYRDIYRRVGTKDWLWFSRLLLSDQDLLDIISDPQCPLWVLRKDGQAQAMLELDFRIPKECELAFFGLTPTLIGQGVGRYLMTQAIRLAWNHPIERFHVHTCTLDSPAALPFYRRSGFTPVRQKIEIIPDPRISLDIPADCGAHIPIFPAF